MNLHTLNIWAVRRGCRLGVFDWGIVVLPRAARRCVEAGKWVYRGSSGGGTEGICDCVFAERGDVVQSCDVSECAGHNAGVGSNCGISGGLWMGSDGAGNHRRV